MACAVVRAKMWLLAYAKACNVLVYVAKTKCGIDELAR